MSTYKTVFPLLPVMDLRIGQIGHGLESRAFRAPHNFLWRLTIHLKICETAQGHNFTIYFETSEMQRSVLDSYQ